MRKFIILASVALVLLVLLAVFLPKMGSVNWGDAFKVPTTQTAQTTETTIATYWAGQPATTTQPQTQLQTQTIDWFATPVTTLTATPTALPTRDPNLVYTKGDHGEEIKAIQSWLLRWGAYGKNATEKEIDGVYGWKTVNAVKWLQKELGMQQTGQIDRETYNQIVWLTSNPQNQAWIGQ